MHEVTCEHGPVRQTCFKCMLDMRILSAGGTSLALCSRWMTAFQFQPAGAADLLPSSSKRKSPLQPPQTIEDSSPCTFYAFCILAIRDPDCTPNAHKAELQALSEDRQSTTQSDRQRDAAVGRHLIRLKVVRLTTVTFLTNAPGLFCHLLTG